MFTGIVEETGTVRHCRPNESGFELAIDCAAVLEDTRLGDSIAVNGVCLTVVMAAKGYPGAYAKGDRIGGLETAGSTSSTLIFHAGTRSDGEAVLADGGRVLGITAQGDDVAQARTPITDFEDETGLTLVPDGEDEEIDTLGGLVFMLAGRVPARGEIVPHPDGANFEVIDADPRRIKRLRVRLNGAEAAE